MTSTVVRASSDERGVPQIQTLPLLVAPSSENAAVAAASSSTVPMTAPTAPAMKTTKARGTSALTSLGSGTPRMEAGTTTIPPDVRTTTLSASTVTK
ncbi:hypothetical protein F442_11843 [Phytophthora nicotianae P10297]|uniref:Uncharacterized protein n=1 Tax=Phytophthora nicotianae P10297 TaxID=1317064 RepID=W2Z1F5_PHYNI|nr:hypothetical protein F442_11843 [Phytophthora nicotianae P10297]